MALITAVVIGIAFGFVLERAGLGSARKLAGQFYFTDFTVIKVMFTAIVVAMLGAFWLSRLGVIDLSVVLVPETFLAPQIVGGAIFGLGFLIAGLCPGTSCVAAATGRGDGLAVVGGMFAGVLATGLLFAPLAGFYQSSAFGPLTLPEVFHLRYGVVVGAIVLMAVIALVIVYRRRVLLPAAALAVVALTTAFSGNPMITRTVEPVELASWIKEHKAGLRVIDTRSAQEYGQLHVASSERAEMEPRDAILVVADGRTYRLRGGIDAWVSDVLQAQHPTPVTRYFGGLRRHGC